jgi:hypothetical protein
MIIIKYRSYEWLIDFCYYLLDHWFRWYIFSKTNPPAPVPVMTGYCAKKMRLLKEVPYCGHGAFLTPGSGIPDG